MFLNTISDSFFSTYPNNFTLLDFVLVVFVIALLFISSITAGFEVAFFSLKHKDLDSIKSESDIKSLKISRLLQRPERLLNSIMLACNISNILIVISSLYLTVRYVNNLWQLILLMFILISSIMILTDMIPKMYALQKPHTFVVRNISLVYFADILFSPLTAIITKLTKAFSKTTIERKYNISLDDLSKALELTSDDKDADNEMEILEGIIRFRDKTAEDIMISRSDIISVDDKTNFTDLIKYIVAAGFSRIPVYEGNQDIIKGVLYVKDLLPNLGKTDSFKWQSLIRPAYFVPGTIRIDDLLEEFRENKNHMAILIDEYGGTMGLVTMEDILEEIVGDISDEYDEEEQPFYYIATDGSYVFEGKTPLEDFIDVTGVLEKDFDKIRENADTIAGLMLELKGDFPKRKEIIDYMDYSFQAEDVGKRRILKVRFIPSGANK